MAGHVAVTRRWALRAGVAADDSPPRHDEPAPVVGPRGVHRRRAPCRVLAGRGVRHLGRAERGRVPTSGRRGSAHRGHLRVAPRSVRRQCGPRHADAQTFHIETGFSEVLFAAPSPVSVGSDRLIIGRADGTAAVLGGFGKDAVYTVMSRSSLPTADDLRAAEARRFGAGASGTGDAADVTARACARPTDHRGLPDDVRQDPCHRAVAGAHTQYSLQAPLSPKGADVVDYFLFTRGSAGANRCRAAWRCSPAASGFPPVSQPGSCRGKGRPIGALRRARTRRPRLDRDLLPRGRVARVRSDRKCAARGRRPHAGSWMEKRATTSAVGDRVGLLFWLAVSAPHLVARCRPVLAGDRGRSGRSAGSNGSAAARAGPGPRRRRRASTPAVADGRGSPARQGGRRSSTATSSRPRARTRARKRPTRSEVLAAAPHPTAAAARAETPNSRAGGCYLRPGREGDPERSLRRRP